MKLPAGVEVRDIMGNPIRADAEPVRFSTAVTYVAGPSSLLEPTLTALEKMQTRPLVRIESRTLIAPDTGQYVLEVRVTNRGDGPLTGVAQLEPAVLQRRFWAGPAEVAAFQAGQSTVIRFELNAYQSETRCPKPGTFFMVLNGIVFRHPLENTLEMEQ
jgi:hypothetical protein